MTRHLYVKVRFLERGLLYCRENLENDTEFEVEGDIPAPGPQTPEPGPSTQADEKAESGELNFFLFWIWFNSIVGIIKTM